MAKAFIVIGLGHGDEGKGLATDFLVRKHNSKVTIRHSGGSQCAHNVTEASGRHHTFSQFGSGTLAGARTHLSKHMLINPVFLRDEERELRDLGVTDPYSMLTAHRLAMITNPFQVAANRLRETHRAGGRHGSCGQGIGETVADAVAWGNPLRAWDLWDVDIMKAKLGVSQERKRKQIEPLMADMPETEDTIREWDILTAPFWSLIEFYREFASKVEIVMDDYLQEVLRSPGAVIFEGNQGVLIDQSMGWFPYVTRSDCTFGNALDLLGGHPATRLGVVRSYMTRHGAGPFVTEDASLSYPEAHNRYGEFQEGFRLGHFDLVALDYALRAVGGVDGIVLTHLDRVDGPQKVCMAYEPGVNLAIPETIPEQKRIMEALMRTRPCYETVGSPEALIREVEKLAPVVMTSHGPTAGDVDERYSNTGSGEIACQLCEEARV
jgi:adenylosuccinate synthase